MSIESPTGIDPRTHSALEELKRIVQKHYPAAVFEVARGEDDPDSFQLIATVDVDDTDKVLDVVIERVLELQVEEHIPVHLVPVRPLERVMQELRSPRRKVRAKADLGTPTPPSQP